MTIDVRRGNPELLPYVFQALIDFERQLMLSSHFAPKTIEGWKDNRDALAQAWESVGTVVVAYGATCPRIENERHDETTESVVQSEGFDADDGHRENDEYHDTDPPPLDR